MNRQQLDRLPWIIRRGDDSGETVVVVDGVRDDRVDAIGTKTVQKLGEAVPQVVNVRVELDLEEVLREWEVWNP
ncbi:MAG TPA: hypothetical protein EYO90_09375 [Candidatus Latescibacteria bacterium]|nr:hypothetical protein [Candidatus Latescibacterota bacterium]